MKTISELQELTNMDVVYVCSHWSQLYNDSAKIGVFIKNQQDIDKLKALNLDIEIMICKKRDGSQFYEPVNTYLYDFEDAQKSLKNHFKDNNNYFYQNNEIFAQAAQDKVNQLLNYYFDNIKDLEDEILEAIKEFKGKKEGYYDCNGTLIISDEEINAPDFCGYYEDVWCYRILAVINTNE